MLLILKKYNFILSVISISILACTSAVVHATNFTIDQFTVTKNGNPFFEDTFSNGNPNDTGTNRTYFTIPDPLSGPETNGRLEINPYDGVIRASPLTGEDLYIQRARLRTNLDNDNLNSGLKVDDTFSVRGLFDLTLPTQFRERFGVRLVDYAAINPAPNDVVEVAVRKKNEGIFVEFREHDVLNSSFNVFENIELTYASLGLPEDIFSMYDQIALKLERTATDGDIFGSFSLVDSTGGESDFLYNFTGSSKIFEGENYTRAEFITTAPVVSSSVPESSTLFLLVIGLLGLFAKGFGNNV